MTANWLIWAQTFIFGYTLSLLGSYAFLVLMASLRFRQKNQLHRVIHDVKLWPSWPPVTVLLPAYNEEAVIVHSVRSALALDYPDCRVVVVCDGSKDRTLEVLQEAFVLQPFEFEPGDTLLETAEIQRCLASPDGRLTVVYKANGGKADALNAGLNVARTPFVCCCDADTLLAKDALKHLVLEVLRNPYVMAVSGTVRLANDIILTEDGFELPDVPGHLLSAVQLNEYSRAFYMARMGFDPLSAIVLISGAFGLFNRHAVVAAGGYSRETQGEDFELVVRLRKNADDKSKPYAITHAPAAMAWTEAPRTFKMLKSQRMRWHRGLLQTLWMHKELLLPRERGCMTSLGYYYYLLFEAAAPLVEVFGYGLFAYFLYRLGWEVVPSWAALAVFAAGTSIYLNSVLHYAHQVGQPLARSPQGVLRMAVAVLCETFFFRFLSLYWRLLATRQVWTRTRAGWGTQVRTGFSQKTTASAPI